MKTEDEAETASSGETQGASNVTKDSAGEQHGEFFNIDSDATWNFSVITA